MAVNLFLYLFSVGVTFMPHLHVLVASGGHDFAEFVNYLIRFPRCKYSAPFANVWCKNLCLWRLIVFNFGICDAPLNLQMSKYLFRMLKKLVSSTGQDTGEDEHLYTHSRS